MSKLMIAAISSLVLLAACGKDEPKKTAQRNANADGADVLPVHSLAPAVEQSSTAKRQLTLTYFTIDG